MNVGTGDGVSMNEVIRVARKVTGCEIAVVHGPPATEPHALIADNAIARSVLGWHPVRSEIERIIADTWDGYRTVVNLQ
jgi:UDP-glucose 4-epimerase